MGNIINSIMSNLTGEGTYTVIGDTDGFFSSYLQQPSDTQASVFKKSTDQFLRKQSTKSSKRFVNKLGNL